MLQPSAGRRAFPVPAMQGTRYPTFEPRHGWLAAAAAAPSAGGAAPSAGMSSGMRCPGTPARVGLLWGRGRSWCGDGGKFLTVLPRIAPSRRDRAAEERQRARARTGSRTVRSRANSASSAGGPCAGTRPVRRVRPDRPPRRAAGVHRSRCRETAPASRPEAAPRYPSGSGSVPGMIASMHRCADRRARMLGISPLTQSSGSAARSSANTASCTRAAIPAAARPAASTSSARSSIAAACARSARTIAAMWSANTSPCTRLGGVRTADTARGCPPANPDSPAKTRRRQPSLFGALAPASLIACRSSPNGEVIVISGDRADRFSPNRPGTPRGLCQSVDG